MTTEFKASRAERSGDGDAVASVSSSSSSSASSSAAAAAPADEEDLAPISPPRAVGGRELRSPQVLPVLLTEGGAAAAASRVVAHAVDCEEEEEEEEESDGLVVVADGPSSSAPAPPAAAPSLLPATSSPLTEGRPACYLVVHNVSKKHNVGSLARAATAFGVSEVRRERASENQATELALSLSSTSTTSSFSFFLLTRFFSLSLSFSLSLTHQIQVILVGKNQYHAFGSHGSAAHVFFRHFPRLSQAKEWLRAEKGARLLGVEIDEGAVSVSAPGVFQGNTAFLMGNEVSIFREGDEMRGKRDRERESSFFSLPPSTPNLLILLLLFKKKKKTTTTTKNSPTLSLQGTGLSPSQIAACDGLVYIPHHGQGTASLNVACAASIVLHRFSEFARYGEAPRSGAKFDVAARPARNAPRGRANLDAAEIAALKEARAARKAAGEEVEGMMEALAL